MTCWGAYETACEYLDQVLTHVIFKTPVAWRVDGCAEGGVCGADCPCGAGICKSVNSLSLPQHIQVQSCNDLDVCTQGDPEVAARGCAADFRGKRGAEQGAAPRVHKPAAER